MIAFVFDFETSGLPLKTNDSYRDLKAYESARIVSVAWRLVDIESWETIRENYFVIKPDGFLIPKEATAIHGISHDEASQQGIAFDEFISLMKSDMYRASIMVAHNLHFDVNVLRSELFRRGKFEEFITYTFRIQRFCTMITAMKLKIVSRFTKLSKLHQILFPEDTESFENAHNAHYDVKYCCKIFRHLYEMSEMSEKSKSDMTVTIDSNVASVINDTNC